MILVYEDVDVDAVKIKKTSLAIQVASFRAVG